MAVHRFTGKPSPHRCPLALVLCACLATAVLWTGCGGAPAPAATPTPQAVAAHWALTAREGVPNPAESSGSVSYGASATDGEVKCLCNDLGTTVSKPGSGTKFVRWSPGPPEQAAPGDVWSFEMEAAGEASGESTKCSAGLVQGGAGGMVTAGAQQQGGFGSLAPAYGPSINIGGTTPSQSLALAYTFPTLEQVKTWSTSTPPSFDLVVMMNGFGWGTPSFKYTYVWNAP